jgi:hypothetical protein
MNREINIESAHILKVGEQELRLSDSELIELHQRIQIRFAVNAISPTKITSPPDDYEMMTRAIAKAISLGIGLEKVEEGNIVARLEYGHSARYFRLPDARSLSYFAQGHELGQQGK